MKPLPKRIIRLDDGIEFVLNKLNNLYYIKLPKKYPKIPKSNSIGYSYERLMNDSRNKGAFKIADGTEDLDAMHKRWLNSIEKICEDDI